MQDVSTPAFMQTIARRGAPDWFVTEFFRVHETSTLSPDLLACATRNATGRPVFAQIIGENIPCLARTARQLAAYPFAGIDLNLGCPAPKVFRKNVGGGLLRDLPHVAKILTALRDALPDALLTVKARIGFDDADAPATLPALIALLNDHRVDLLTLHGRTVRGLYRSPVNYAAIAAAVRDARCPVIANGDITSAAKAARVLAETGCAGLMAGRHAIRNPWIFRQIREHLSGQPLFQPTLADVHAYILELARDADDTNIASAVLPIYGEGMPHATASPLPIASAVLPVYGEGMPTATASSVPPPIAARQVPPTASTSTTSTTAASATTAAASARLAARLKKFLNFVGTAVDPAGLFLYEMRRAPDMDALRRICDTHLLSAGRAALPYPLEPLPGLVSRPNCEA